MSIATDDNNRDEHDVAGYYDSNTRRFLAMGGGRRAQAIHRPLWGPGIHDVHAASNYSNVLIGDAIDSLGTGPAFHLLDFGCGVGGSLFALARRFPDAGFNGVTISQRQFDMARAFAATAGLDRNCKFHRGDFESIDLGIQADVVIAIESMVHAQSTAAFLDNAARHLNPGGTLIVIDDFVAQLEPLRDDQQQLLAEFRAGWRLSSLSTVAAFVAVAESHGFALVESLDLSPMIRLTRPRDRAIAAISPVLRRFTAVPMIANMVGGAALTRGTKAGLLSYRWLRLAR